MNGLKSILYYISFPSVCKYYCKFNPTFSFTTTKPQDTTLWQRSMIENIQQS